MQGGLTTNTLPASIDMARKGLGLAYTFRDFVADDIAAGDLVSVLGSHLGVTPGIFIYFPREYRTMTPLRLFMEHLRSG